MVARYGSKRGRNLRRDRRNCASFPRRRPGWRGGLEPAADAGRVTAQRNSAAVHYYEVSLVDRCEDVRFYFALMYAGSR